MKNKNCKRRQNRRKYNNDFNKSSQIMPPAISINSITKLSRTMKKFTASDVGLACELQTKYAHYYCQTKNFTVARFFRNIDRFDTYYNGIFFRCLGCRAIQNVRLVIAVLVFQIIGGEREWNYRKVRMLNSKEYTTHRKLISSLWENFSAMMSLAISFTTLIAHIFWYRHGQVMYAIVW